MGEVIVTTGSIPQTDIFSFTGAGKPFLVQNWFAEVSYYLLYRAGGLELLVFANALLLAGALVPVFLLCRQSAASLRLGAFVATLAALTFFYHARPQTFSVVLFAIFYWILDGYRHRRSNRLWAMPLLMALWANLHGAFVLGLALILLYLACEAFRWLLAAPEGDRLSARELVRLFLVLVSSLAATLANPLFYRIYGYVWTVASDKASQLFVTEWQPPLVDTLEGLLFFYGFFFICLISFFHSRRKLGLTDLVLFTAFSVFALTALRNTIWFSIIAAPILSRHLKSVPFADMPAPRIRAWIDRILALPAFKGGGSGPRYRLNFAFALAGCLALVLFSPWIRPGLRKTSLLDPNTPAAAMNFIERNAITGRIFHPQIFGDYLIWRLWPKQKSFIDGRVHLFGESFVKEYMELFSDSGWEDTLQRYGIQFLLLNKAKDESEPPKMPARARKSKHWRVLYEDDVSVLLQRVAQPES